MDALAWKLNVNLLKKVVQDWNGPARKMAAGSPRVLEEDPLDVHGVVQEVERRSNVGVQIVCDLCFDGLDKLE